MPPPRLCPKRPIRARSTRPAAISVPVAAEHGEEILHLAAVRVGAERLRIIDPVSARAHAGAGEVEADGHESALGEEGAEVGEEPPLHEPFEAVADHDRRPRSGMVLRVGQVDEAVESGTGRGGEREGSRGCHAGIVGDRLPP